MNLRPRVSPDDGPEGVRRLPRDANGFPIPYFVPTLPDGTRDLRVACATKKLEAFQLELCWVCGESLGRRDRAFIGGPASVWSKTFSDWCSHVDCAVYAAQACPHLNGDMRKRSSRPFPDGTGVVPGQIDDRPPLACLYVIGHARAVLFERRIAVFVPPPARYVWHFRDGVKISNQEAEPVVREYLRQVIGRLADSQKNG